MCVITRLTICWSTVTSSEFVAFNKNVELYIAMNNATSIYGNTYYQPANIDASNERGLLHYAPAT